MKKFFVFPNSPCTATTNDADIDTHAHSLSCFLLTAKRKKQITKTRQFASNNNTRISTNFFSTLSFCFSSTLLYSCLYIYVFININFLTNLQNSKLLPNQRKNRQSGSIETEKPNVCITKKSTSQTHHLSHSFHYRSFALKNNK